jgi:iduronate 2-sulfatase
MCVPWFAQRANGITTPFFMAVGFHKPHLPFIVPERHIAKYPIAGIQVSYQ